MRTLGLGAGARRLLRSAGIVPAAIEHEGCSMRSEEEARRAAQLTQLDVVIRLRLARFTIPMTENGRRGVSPAELAAFATPYGVTVDQLSAGTAPLIRSSKSKNPSQLLTRA